MSNEAFITANVANEALVGLTEAALKVWEPKLVEAQAAFDAKREEDIADVIATKKTFWTRRTRTREEAIRYIQEVNWFWLNEERSILLRAVNNIDRLKEILAIASEPEFQNITLTERDLRLVGGHAE